MAKTTQGRPKGVVSWRAASDRGCVESVSCSFRMGLGVNARDEKRRVLPLSQFSSSAKNGSKSGPRGGFETVRNLGSWLFSG